LPGKSSTAQHFHHRLLLEQPGRNLKPSVLRFAKFEKLLISQGHTFLVVKGGPRPKVVDPRLDWLSGGVEKVKSQKFPAPGDKRRREKELTALSGMAHVSCVVPVEWSSGRRGLQPNAPCLFMAAADGAADARVSVGLTTGAEK
jgi:hypothetical protein